MILFSAGKIIELNTESRGKISLYVEKPQEKTKKEINGEEKLKITVDNETFDCVGLCSFCGRYFTGDSKIRRPDLCSLVYLKKEEEKRIYLVTFPRVAEYTRILENDFNEDLSQSNRSLAQILKAQDELKVKPEELLDIIEVFGKTLENRKEKIEFYYEKNQKANLLEKEKFIKAMDTFNEGFEKTHELLEQLKKQPQSQLQPDSDKGLIVLFVFVIILIILSLFSATKSDTKSDIK